MSVPATLYVLMRRALIWLQDTFWCILSHRMKRMHPHDTRKSHRGIKIHWEKNQRSCHDNDCIFLSDQIYNPILTQSKCFSVTEDKTEGGEKSKNERLNLGNLMTCRVNYMYFHSYTYKHLSLMVSYDRIIYWKNLQSVEALKGITLPKGNRDMFYMRII